MSEEKKIIVDEDWKNQVAAEKQAAAAGDAAVEGADGLPPIPEASFELLVTTFVTEAMVALGQFPHPATGELQFDPDHARFAIDMLEVIAAKTKGNLTPEEEHGLREVIHQLRMAFLAVSSQLSAVSQKVETPSSFLAES